MLSVDIFRLGRLRYHSDCPEKKIHIWHIHIMQNDFIVYRVKCSYSFRERDTTTAVYHSAKLFKKRTNVFPNSTLQMLWERKVLIRLFIQLLPEFLRISTKHLLTLAVVVIELHASKRGSALSWSGPCLNNHVSTFCIHLKRLLFNIPLLRTVPIEEQ